MLVLCLYSSLGICVWQLLEIRCWDSHTFGSCWYYVFMRKKIHCSRTYRGSASHQCQLMAMLCHRALAGNQNSLCFPPNTAESLQPADTGTRKLYHMAFPEIERHCLDYLWVGRKRESKGNAIKSCSILPG